VVVAGAASFGATESSSTVGYDEGGGRLVEGALDDALLRLELDERLAPELEDARVEDTCAEVG